MIKKFTPIILTLAVIAVVGWMLNERNSGHERAVRGNGIVATVYKSPYCSCCEKWGAYMGNEGYEVTVVEEVNMSPIKERFGVPYELESCHTAEIEGYVIEGHIPNEAIEKLLDEKPDIKGIGMAGMPSGSPGMPGFKEDFMIYEIHHDGTKGDLFMKL